VPENGLGLWMQHMTERIALLIDGENLHSTAKNLGFEIDFKRLLQEFETLGTVVRAYFYTRVRDDDAFHNIRPLIDWLDYNGFTVKTRPVKEHDDGEGRRKIKRSIGVDLTVDALEIARHVNHIFLLSGDGDFRRLAESLQRTGIRVTVVSSLRTTPPIVSDELRRQANNFIEINTLRRSIERSPHPIAPK
jgi:uncharacterized LabA/DUF88 family protein